MTPPNQPVVILGAGINDAALARELVLNDLPVVVIDKADVASGTTAVWPISWFLIFGHDSGILYRGHFQMSAPPSFNPEPEATAVAHQAAYNNNRRLRLGVERGHRKPDSA